MENNIETLFNEAFYLLNSKDLSTIEENYYFYFEKGKSYSKLKKCSAPYLLDQKLPILK